MLESAGHAFSLKYVPLIMIGYFALDLPSGKRATALTGKGTPVLCRILRISRWYGHGDEGRKRVELLLSLENFALPGDQRAVYALPDRGRSGPMELGPLNAMGRSQWFTNFWSAGDDYVIKSGLASDWVTVAP
jgi:hypothetical protein